MIRVPVWVKSLGFSETHVLWIIDHAGGFPRDPDYWAYLPQASQFIKRFRLKFGYFSENAVCRVAIHTRKIRYVSGKKKKLTKFTTTKAQPALPALPQKWWLSLAKMYADWGVPSDHLPRSKIVATWAKVLGATPQLTWNTLLRMRKCGKLPRVGRRSA